MAKIKNFEEMKVWKDAAAIAVKVYRLCEGPRLSKDFGSKDQLRRAALSISNNIAEGFEYNNNSDFVRFLRYSKGSAGELRSNLHILRDAEVIGRDDFDDLRSELISISKELEGFIKYLRNFDSASKRSDNER